MKKAFITGITGQDGSYLADLLLEKGYEVHGLKRPSSTFNTERIDHIFANTESNIHTHYGDLTESSSIINLINTIQPDEIYNLGAQSHVKVSFETPEYTANVDALGTLRVLEAIRLLGLENKVKFYQASSSELYGYVQEIPQTEKTPFYPRSPYAVSKLYAYWITVNYREAYNMYACNGILFNHESPRRGATFVTRKITRGLANIFFGLQDYIYLGNLDAMRDWGHARDYVEMQWLMLQQEKPKDFVIATGQQYSVREFLQLACLELGVELEFKGSGLDEVGIVKSVSSSEEINVKKNDILIRVSEKYFRPSEVETLLGDPSKAKSELGWKPKTSFKSLVSEMMQYDIRIAKERKILLNAR